MTVTLGNVSMLAVTEKRAAKLPQSTSRARINSHGHAARSMPGHPVWEEILTTLNRGVVQTPHSGGFGFAFL